MSAALSVLSVLAVMRCVVIALGIQVDEAPKTLRRARLGRQLESQKNDCAGKGGEGKTGSTRMGCFGDM